MRDRAEARERRRPAVRARHGDAGSARDHAQHPLVTRIEGPQRNGLRIDARRPEPAAQQQRSRGVQRLERRAVDRGDGAGGPIASIERLQRRVELLQPRQAPRARQAQQRPAVAGLDPAVLSGPVQPLPLRSPG